MLVGHLVGPHWSGIRLHPCRWWIPSYFESCSSELPKVQRAQPKLLEKIVRNIRNRKLGTFVRFVLGFRGGWPAESDQAWPREWRCASGVSGEDAPHPVRWWRTGELVNDPWETQTPHLSFLGRGSNGHRSMELLCTKLSLLKHSPLLSWFFLVLRAWPLLLSVLLLLKFLFLFPAWASWAKHLVLYFCKKVIQ